MTKTLHGVIRGNTIELTDELGGTEGQQVEVRVTFIQPQSDVPTVSTVAGALKDDEHWDRIMEEVHQARKSNRRKPVDFE